MRPSLITCIALVGAAALVLQSTAPAMVVPAAGGGENVIKSEPLVIFNLGGFSLLGAIHRHLVVYKSGLAAFSSASGFP